MIFLRRDIAFYFQETLSFEILGDKILVINLEIVLHILQSGIVVFHHHIGVLTNDMDLLLLLFIELIQHAVILFGVTIFRFFQPMDLHGVV